MQTPGRARPDRGVGALAVRRGDLQDDGAVRAALRARRVGRSCPIRRNSIRLPRTSGSCASGCSRLGSNDPSHECGRDRGRSRRNNSGEVPSGPSPVPRTPMRLAKFLAHGGVASRRKAEVIIAKGRVRVGGEVVTDPARDVTDADEVRVDGSLVGAEAREVWAVNKPAGVVSTAREPGGRPAVVELVDTTARLYPVGRLDAESTGLLLADQRRGAGQPADASALRGAQGLPGGAAAAAVRCRSGAAAAWGGARGRADGAGRGSAASASARSRSSCARGATGRCGGWRRRSATGW